MSRRSRRNHSPIFHTKVALAATQGVRRRWRSWHNYTMWHTTQIAAWKSQLLEGAADVFGSGSAEASPGIGVDPKTLHAKIGELTLENDFIRCARQGGIC